MRQATSRSCCPWASERGSCSCRTPQPRRRCSAWCRSRSRPRSTSGTTASWSCWPSARTRGRRPSGRPRRRHRADRVELRDRPRRPPSGSRGTPGRLRRRGDARSTTGCPSVVHSSWPTRLPAHRRPAAVRRHHWLRRASRQLVDTVGELTGRLRLRDQDPELRPRRHAGLQPDERAPGHRFRRYPQLPRRRLRPDGEPAAPARGHPRQAPGPRGRRGVHRERRPGRLGAPRHRAVPSELYRFAQAISQVDPAQTTTCVLDRPPGDVEGDRRRHRQPRRG